ncbi:MAG: BrnT family toxin [Deltaproteobacteria bacterium]|nr:BrnT family toxin [Deltaproteobacteria bacterium]
MARLVTHGSFVWDEEKEAYNKQVHKIGFAEASQAFFDPNRVIAVDEAHSKIEERSFCIGKVGNRIATVRFTYRGSKIRIIGAGFWRKGRKFYEKKKKQN